MGILNNHETGQMMIFNNKSKIRVHYNQKLSEIKNSKLLKKHRYKNDLKSYDIKNLTLVMDILTTTVLPRPKK